jgi:hypothetical protein
VGSEKKAPRYPLNADLPKKTQLSLEHKKALKVIAAQEGLDFGNQVDKLENLERVEVVFTKPTYTQLGPNKTEQYVIYIAELVYTFRRRKRHRMSTPKSIHRLCRWLRIT